MCGIAGIVNFRGHEIAAVRPKIERMTDLIKHRGPDDDGFYLDSLAALGHRRLSIIDLESGHQPMSGLDDKVQIVFNGEIYNFQALRSDLEKRGHGFRTASDTEVIIAAYAEWGDSCVSKLDGMFAFAIWDTRQNTLLLARDRVGKKPLYYQRNGDEILFSSELKSIMSGRVRAGEIDPEAVECYLTLGYIPAPRTIYKDVLKLRPGHTMRFTNMACQERTYWTLSFQEPKPKSLDQATDEFEGLLDDAVRARMISDVPLGAFLSGGLDSSLVVSSMAAQQSAPIKTHTIGFDQSEFSELGSARLIADALKTQHLEHTVTPDVGGVLKKIAWHFDEPFSDSSALPTWYVCEMTRKSVTVALSGDGGDEGFGGYSFRYLPHLFESGVRDSIPVWLRKMIFSPLGSIWPGFAWLPRPLRLKSILENLSLSDSQAFYRDLIWLRPDIRRSVYHPDFLSSLQGFTSFEAVEPFYANSNAPDALARSQFADINVFMTDDVLVKVDRMSMAHSLEVRSPLLDHRILEFAVNLPKDTKVDFRQGKLPLRRLAARRLPPEVHKMPKRGFSIPAAKWIRQDLREMVEDLVFHQQGLITEVLNQRVLSEMWDQHQNRARDHSVFFWGLMMLGLWEQECRS